MIANVVPQGLFGPGVLWVTRTDIANATPANVGFVNEFSTDLSYEVKDLYGQKSFPLLSARGTAKATGKIKAATLSGQALSSLIIGGSWTSGTQYDTAASPSTAIPTAGTITPAVPSSGTFNQDLGVVDASTGEPFVKVAWVTAGPGAVNEYAVQPGTGIYYFNSGDLGRNVIIDFVYTYTGAAGESQTFTNPDIGTTPTFQIDYKTTLYGATYYLRIFQAIATKWTQAHKITDFSMPEYDFSFFANAAQQIGIISLATQA